MPFRTYSRESEIIGYALSWSLQAWLLLVLALVALALARSAWQVQYGCEWRVVARRNLAIAGIVALAVPFAAAVGVLVLIVVMQPAPSAERDRAEPWLEAVCQGPAGERGKDLARLLPALQTPRPQGLRAPHRQALLRGLMGCLRGQDAASLAPDRDSLERLHRVLSDSGHDPSQPMEYLLQGQIVGTLEWLLLAPDLHAAVKACQDSNYAAAAIRAAASWCERQSASCQHGLPLQDLDRIELWARVRWPGWAITSMPEMQILRRRLQEHSSEHESSSNSG